MYLSDHYIEATTEEQRAAFAAAAEGFIAQNIIPNAPGILTPVGILILSFVMLEASSIRASPIWASPLAPSALSVRPFGPC
jgi:hypothetical protein